MKKALSLIFALTMCMALAIPAMAATPTDFDAIELSIEGGMACGSNDYIDLWAVESYFGDLATLRNRVTYVKPGARFHAKNLNPDYKFRIYYQTYAYHPAPDIYEFEGAKYDGGTIQARDLGGHYVYIGSDILVPEYHTNFLRNDGKWNGYCDNEDYPDAVGGTYEGSDNGVLVLENEKEIIFTLPESSTTDAYYVVCAEIEKDLPQEQRIEYKRKYYTVRFDGGKVTAGGYQAAPQIAIDFTDVPTDAYYADAVKWAIEKNITNGTSSTTFSPDDTCTTAQILTFLHRAKGSPAPTQGNPYSDVKSGDYFYNAALWARENSLTGDGSFNGGTPCTRAAVVTYLWKLAGKPSAGNAAFTDVPESADYAQAVAWAVAQGITNGTGDTTFSPDATCTRGQIVTFLYRAYGK